MKLFQTLCVGIILLPTSSLWSQVDSTSTQPATANSTDNSTANSDNSDSRMLTPPPVSGQSYPTSPTSEERSNYLRTGVAFTSAYTDNALGSLIGHPVSDVSYSVYPTLALDETTSRAHAVLNYAPGFTFYQRESGLNSENQNVAINFHYRVSPHVGLSVGDSFQKTSNVFNQPDLTSSAVVSGGSQMPNSSVIPPTAETLNNFGNVGVTYQFALNGMVGASGTFSNLHFPNQAQVPGLSDSASQGGSAFYSLRVSKMHYVGVTYQYQRLISYPTTGQNETQTHAIVLFYTLYASSKLSLSFFGGPQHSNIVEPPIGPAQLQLPASQAWTPSAGGSLNWQGRLSSVAISYSHTISGGGGLTGAVKMDSANASFRQQISRRLSGSVSGMYAQNDVLGSILAGSTNGHTVSGSASLQQAIGQNLTVQLGYTRLHEDYSGVALLAGTPNTNREFASISYQFSRPLGR
jgi:hypothetical protein